MKNMVDLEVTVKVIDKNITLNLKLTTEHAPLHLENKVKVMVKVIDKNITLNLKLTTGHVLLHLG